MSEKSELSQLLAASPSEYASAFADKPSAFAEILHVESTQIATALADDDQWSGGDDASIAETLSAEPLEMATVIAGEATVMQRLLSVEAAAIGEAAELRLDDLGTQLAASPEEIAAARSGEPGRLVSLLSGAKDAKGS